MQVATIKEGLFKNICAEAGIDWTQEAENQWLSETFQAFSGCEGDELLCQPSGNNDSFFNLELLRGCQSQEPVIRKTVTGGLNPQQWFANEIQPLLHPFTFNTIHSYIGVDVGADNDPTAIALLFEERGLPRVIKCGLYIEIRGCPLEEQVTLLKLIIGAMPNFKSGAIDATGIGLSVGQGVHKRFGSVEACHLTGQWHDRAWGHLRRFLESQALTLPQDADITQDFMAVKKLNGSPRIAKEGRYRGADGYKRHADAAVAFALATSKIQIDQPRIPTVRPPGTVWSPRQQRWVKLVAS